tara:strand:+ start:210 stop:635 length:426 start_codon:yes stop_codon:yes gene_type:complete
MNILKYFNTRKSDISQPKQLVIGDDNKPVMSRDGKPLMRHPSLLDDNGQVVYSNALKVQFIPEEDKECPKTLSLALLKDMDKEFKETHSSTKSLNIDFKSTYQKLGKSSTKDVTHPESGETIQVIEAYYSPYKPLVSSLSV